MYGDLVVRILPLGVHYRRLHLHVLREIIRLHYANNVEVKCSISGFFFLSIYCMSVIYEHYR
jgi:hypothetical protein